MIYKGSRTGVGGQVVSLAGCFAMIFLSVKYYTLCSEAIFGFLLQRWAKPASFLVICVLIFVIVKVLERVANVISGEEVASIERIGGVVVASLRAAVFFGLIGMFLLLVPVDYMRLSVENSKTCMSFVNFDAKVYSWISGLTGVPKEKQRNKNEVVEEFLTAAEKQYD